MKAIFSSGWGHDLVSLPSLSGENRGSKAGALCGLDSSWPMYQVFCPNQATGFALWTVGSPARQFLIKCCWAYSKLLYLGFLGRQDWELYLVVYWARTQNLHSPLPIWIDTNQGQSQQGPIWTPKLADLAIPPSSWVTAPPSCSLDEQKPWFGLPWVLDIGSQPIKTWVLPCCKPPSFLLHDSQIPTGQAPKAPPGHFCGVRLSWSSQEITHSFGGCSASCLFFLRGRTVESGSWPA